MIPFVQIHIVPSSIRVRVKEQDVHIVLLIHPSHLTSRLKYII